jgi:hypothetical protein
MIRRLWSWVRPLVIQDCPETIAVCEFDCRTPTCLRKEWEGCAYRRRHQRDGLERAPSWPSRPSAGSGGRADRGRA